MQTVTERKKEKEKWDKATIVQADRYLRVFKREIRIVDNDERIFRDLLLQNSEIKKNYFLITSKDAQMAVTYFRGSNSEKKGKYSSTFASKVFPLFALTNELALQRHLRIQIAARRKNMRWNVY